jgi:hypothetical protein
MKLAAHGIAANLPDGWEGSIASEDQERITAQMHAFGTSPQAPETLPVAHFATFGLPAVRSDFGGAVVTGMGPDDVFVSLLEYAPEEAGSELFSRQGMPWRLDARDFSPRMLQRGVRGQSGLQVFFTERGRAFCLYIVLGAAARAERLVRRAEQVLATIQIEERT